jgi:multidrug efflux pump subunit AcrA (membrane-fusion protein)
VALRGKQTVELEFSVDADFVPDSGIGMCFAEDRMLLVTLTGGVQVLDPDQNVVEPIGGGARLMVGNTHRLRLEHDGAKTMKVSVDDKETAVVRNVGRLTAGDVVLFVRSSTPMQVTRLSISGVPSPLDPQQVRDRYVAGVIARLWP